MQNRSQRASDPVHEVISQHSAMVYRLAYARTGSRADAEDVYQEVFFRLFRTKPRIESAEHLRAWLIRTTIHVSISLFRSAWRRRVRPLPEGYDPPAVPPQQDPRAEALHSALMCLPEKQRVAIHLFYYEEFSTEEIAKLLGENPSTVRSQLSRARKRLRTLLKEVE